MPIREVPSNQERYLLAERFTDASYPIPFSYRIRGDLMADRLERAINDVVARHEILRAHIQSDRHGFHAEIVSEVTIRIVKEDYIGTSPEEARRRIATFFDVKVKDFAPTELVRVHLARLSSTEQILTLSLHHAIGDGVSMNIFAGEVFARYRGEALGAPGPSFYDVVKDRTSDQPSFKADRDWWKSRLANVETVASLGSDLDGPKKDPGEITISMPFASIQATAQSFGVTPFTMMLGISQFVIARFSGSDDVQLTIQSAGRRAFENNDNTIGPFSNSVILSTRLDQDDKLSDFFWSRRDELRQALEHESYPYHLVVRDTGIQPRFGINWFPDDSRHDVPGLEISPREFLFYDSNYDLNIRFVRSDKALNLIIHYKASEFSKERVSEIAEAMVVAVHEVAPERTLRELLPQPEPLVVPAGQVLSDDRIYDSFLRQAAATPSRTALVADGRNYTYAEVEAESRALASRLIAAGLGPGSRVAILAVRGPRLIWSIIGTLRTGATMVPLDADYPEERLRALCVIAAVDALVLPVSGPTPGWAAGTKQVLAASDPGAPVPDGLDPRQLAAGSADDPAYMLFTSGSTGTPKCIATSHRPMLNFLAWQRETFSVTIDDRFTNLCGVAHDMMMRDIFAPLSIGASLAIPDQATIYKPGQLLDWLIAERPTVSHLTPAMAKLLLLGDRPKNSLSHRLLFFGGDRLTWPVVQGLGQLAQAAEIINFYGATETPQAAAFHRCDPSKHWRTYPIGAGISGFQLRIVDTNRQPVPDGAPGEIAVLSEFLSLGYVVDGDIRPHSQPGVYFTGDNGFQLPSGEIMFTGRADDQVNIRGYRIELDEIVATITSFSGVRDAQVLTEGEDNAKLVAFAVGHQLDEDALYAWLNSKLPHYMVPSEIVCIDALPLLPNGKLDRKGLLALPRPKRIREDLRAPETELEVELVEAWRRHLPLPISPDQSFAELRGDSLAYVQVFLATEAIVGALPDDWQTMKLSELAALKRSGRGWFKMIDSAMLVRAMAIILVVAFHLKVFSAGGGATSALLMVSGFLIGKLQIREVARTASSLPLWRLVGRVALPSVVYTTAFFLIKTALGKPVDPSVPLLYADFIDYSDPVRNILTGNAFFLWYISCFIHMMAAFAVVTILALRFAPQAVAKKSYPIILFVAALPLKFVLPGLFDSWVFEHGIRPLSAFGYTPTSHFSTLMLGVCLASVISWREKLIWYGVVLAYAAATYFYVPSNSFMIMAAVGTILLFVRRVPIPTGVHLPILYLSGASLFIYLTHIQAGLALEALGIPEGSVWLLVPVICVGVLVWYLWQKMVPMARRVSPL